MSGNRLPLPTACQDYSFSGPASILLCVQ